MKRYLLPALAVLLVAGCASTRQSEFFDHSSVYQGWSHMKYSVITYRNPGAEEIRKSGQDEWWGIRVDYPLPQDGTLR